MKEQQGTRFIYFECQQGSAQKFIEKFAEKLNFTFSRNLVHERKPGLLMFLLARYFDTKQEENGNTKEQDNIIQEERMLGDIFDYLLVTSSKIGLKESKSFLKRAFSLVTKKATPVTDKPKCVIIVDGVETLPDNVIQELREGAKKLTHQNMVHMCLITRKEFRAIHHIMAADSSRLDTLEIPELGNEEVIQYLVKSDSIPLYQSASDFAAVTGGLFGFLRHVDSHRPLSQVEAKVALVLNRWMNYMQNQAAEDGIDFVEILRFILARGGSVSSFIFLEQCCNGSFELFKKLTKMVLAERYRGGIIGTVEFQNRAVARYVPEYINRKQEARSTKK
jgi:hypothetical protein